MKLIIRDCASHEIYETRNYQGWYDTVPVPRSGDHIVLGGKDFHVFRVYIQYHEVPRSTVTVDVQPTGVFFS
jgi:hypothetical protein